MLPAGDGQGGDAGKDLARVCLGSRAEAVAAVEVGTSNNMSYRFVNVNKMKEAKE
jgi:hypothetical protein